MDVEDGSPDLNPIHCHPDSLPPLDALATRVGIDNLLGSAKWWQ